LAVRSIGQTLPPSKKTFAAISGQLTAVSVDLAEVTYIDSAGKRLPFDLASHLQESYIVLELIVPFASPIRRLIELSGLRSLAALLLMRCQDSTEGGRHCAPGVLELLNSLLDSGRWYVRRSPRHLGRQR
jgi:ABC-type transporter Mla MlaB component